MSRVYSNCYCSCSFGAEIMKIGQSSHKMYINNILKFQEFTTVLQAHTKKNLETYCIHLVAWVWHLSSNWWDHSQSGFIQLSTKPEYDKYHSCPHSSSPREGGIERFDWSSGAFPAGNTYIAWLTWLLGTWRDSYMRNAEGPKHFWNNHACLDLGVASQNETIICHTQATEEDVKESFSSVDILLNTPEMNLYYAF